MNVPSLPDRTGLLAAWHQLIAQSECDRHGWYELDEFGAVVTHVCPSARRQIVLTDIYFQLTEQIGHLAAMSVPVATRSYGIRVPDVVWMAPERWADFDRDDPVPFVPDLCVEVLCDSDRRLDMDRRVSAYVEGGATEVILVRQDGRVEFWGAQGARSAPAFGIRLSLERIYFEEEGASSSERGLRC